MKKSITIWISIFILVFILSSCTEEGLISDNNILQENQNSLDTSKLIIATKIVETIPTLENVIVEPTYDIELKEAEINKLINNVGEEKLPCWFNICSGETSWEVASNILKLLNMNDLSQNLPDGSIYHGVHGFNIYDDYFIQSLSFVEQNEIITKSGILVNGYSNMSEFHRVWENYAPRNLINNYGKPDRIFVYIHDDQGYGGNTTGYYIWFVYEDLNFFIEYQGRTEYDEIFSICPRFDNEEDIGVLEIISVSKYSDLDLMLTIDGEKRLNSDKMKELNQISDMSIDDLYNDFLYGDGCFDTSLDFWKVE